MPTTSHTDRVSQRVCGFTLVELMVVLVIVALLASLTLAGLAGTRDRAKADKTRSTIRKLHEIVIPQYESYLTRRVPSASSGPPGVSRLCALRLLMSLEMPDQWSDVDVTGLPPWTATATVKRYAAFKAASIHSRPYQDAECLAMIVTRGGFNSDAVESFRSDELGDIDKDGCPEFLDGWGKPIGFIRWPAGFDSPFQPQDASANPDPFDPMRRSKSIVFPPTVLQRDYGLTPLIFSGGADEALDPPADSTSYSTYGGYYAASYIDPSASWIATFAGPSATSLVSSGTVPSTRTFVSGSIAPGVMADVTARDNITNFYLLKK